MNCPRCENEQLKYNYYYECENCGYIIYDLIGIQRFRINDISIRIVVDEVLGKKNTTEIIYKNQMFLLNFIVDPKITEDRIKKLLVLL
jgi:uncharacterized Zn finger protein